LCPACSVDAGGISLRSDDVCDNAAVRRTAIAAVAVVVVLVVAGVVVLRVLREREWAHGSDRLTVQVDVALATQDTFEGVVVRLGTPPGRATRLHSAAQSVVVRVRWSASSPSHGSYELIALDGRVTPPRPLAADGGGNSEGATGLRLRPVASCLTQDGRRAHRSGASPTGWTSPPRPTTTGASGRCRAT
jgi:hypothetical protein